MRLISHWQQTIIAAVKALRLLRDTWFSALGAMAAGMQATTKVLERAQNCETARDFTCSHLSDHALHAAANKHAGPPLHAASRKKRSRASTDTAPTVNSMLSAEHDPCTAISGSCGHCPCLRDTAICAQAQIAPGTGQPSPPSCARPRFAPRHKFGPGTGLQVLRPHRAGLLRVRPRRARAPGLGGPAPGAAGPVPGVPPDQDVVESSRAACLESRVCRSVHEAYVQSPPALVCKLAKCDPTGSATAWTWCGAARTPWPTQPSPCPSSAPWTPWSPCRDGHLADLTYVELHRDDRQALLRKLP